jgi:SAM-dependent methyltransferase
MSFFCSPRAVEGVGDCYFYHTMDLPDLGTVHGPWDLRNRLGDYLGGVPLANRRVLEIGTADGFISFEMERSGATIVSFEADTARCFSELPFPDSLYSTNRTAWLTNINKYLEASKNAYWLAHRLYKSSARLYCGDVYDLPEPLGLFDVVVVAQILVHLRDPIAGLEQAARRCSDTLIIAEGMVDHPEPIMRLCGTLESGRPYAWFHLSTDLYRQLLSMLGFEIVRITECQYSCHYPGYASSIPLTTIVARKVRLDRSLPRCRSNSD